MIARLSDGGMRDALSLLDQCVAVSGEVDLDAVSSASGIAGRDYLFDIIECVADKDAAGAIKIINKLYDMSKDLKVLAGELLEQIRNVMLIKTIGDSRELITCLPEEYDRLTAAAERFTLDEVLADIGVLQESSERFARSTSKRIEMEMCAVKLCSPKVGGSAVRGQNGADVAALNDRIGQLENALRNGVVAVPQKSAPPKAPEKPVRQVDPDFKNVKTDRAAVVEDWGNIVSQINETDKSIGTFLKKSKAFMLENNLFLIVDNDFFLKLFKETNAAATLNEVLKKNYGKTFNIKVKSAKNVAPEDSENPINQLLQKAKSLDIEVEIKK
jgi:DNA polymerase-3 subunit gamma/tau